MLDAAISAIPEGWFIDSMGERVKPIIYRDEQHTSLGKFYCALQHRTGGMLTMAEGQTLAAAVYDAIRLIASNPDWQNG